ETIELRFRTAERLTALGLAVAPSVANFLLVRFDDAAAAYDHLIAAGVLVRRVKGYGLPDHLRIGIGRADEMDRLCDALAAYLSRDGR
ncbi:MAG: aminotransferase class I/II-fold pyridoxal phosphate-dependent enzyme, partial [Pseudomonadota bacterium]